MIARLTIRLSCGASGLSLGSRQLQPVVRRPLLLLHYFIFIVVEISSVCCYRYVCTESGCFFYS
jgi:hypothetical protein